MIEIEHKFLVNIDKLPNLNILPSKKIIQGYLSVKPTVRVRITNDGILSESFITVKGDGSLSKAEIECPITYQHALEMMKLTSGKIFKTRYYFQGIQDSDIKWEIDVFEELNEGLVLAEIEIPQEGYPFIKPNWIGDEVTFNKKYSNASLSQFPYTQWV